MFTQDDYLLKLWHETQIIHKKAVLHVLNDLIFQISNYNTN